MGPPTLATGTAAACTVRLRADRELRGVSRLRADPAFLPALCVCTAPGNLAAQQTGVMTGTVADLTSGAPLAGAPLTVEGTASGALTNADGRFVVPRHPRGRVTVSDELAPQRLCFAGDKGCVHGGPSEE